VQTLGENEKRKLRGDGEGDWERFGYWALAHADGDF